MAAKKRRADELLLEKLNLESLELARALIMEGRALSGDSRITGAAQLLKEDAPLRVKGVLNPYVSRGAHKLKKALEVFDLSVKDRCLPGHRLLHRRLYRRNASRRRTPGLRPGRGL